MIEFFLWFFGVALCLSSYVPLLKFGTWWIRIWDFPRFQALILECLLLVTFLAQGVDGWVETVAALVLFGATLLDLYRIHRYLPLANLRQAHPPSGQEGLQSLKVVTANVRQKNTEFGKFLELIVTESPDVVVAIETDDRWDHALKPLSQDYPYSVLHPQDNTYGFLFFSKFPIVAHQLHHWTDKKVPSLQATLQIADEIQMEVFVIHPRPPRPEEGDSDQRDGELIQAGGRIQGVQGHVLVIGDLNDVAWSHTTRLFLRVSGLLDPRMGRGLFNTFHASFPFMRFPLDHIFFSDNFFLVSMERLGKIGSDHFPMSIEIAPQRAERTRLGKVNPSDHRDVAEYREKGRRWDSPDEDVSG